MANGNWRIPLSSRLSWWIKLHRLRRHNIQRSFWLIPPHLPLPRRRTNWSKNLRADQDLDPTLTDLSFFCGTKWHHYRDICPASGQTCSCCHKTDHFAGVRQQVAKDNRVSKPTSHKPTPPDPRRGHMRLVEQEEHSYTLPKEGIQYENFFTLSSGQPPDTSVTTTASPSNKGHFVLFLLDKPDSNRRVQISFQIDSVDTSMQIWPTLGTWTLEFISKNWTSLFQGLGFCGPPVGLDLNPDVKPIHAPNNCEPISKLDAIKATLDAYETTGKLVRVSQPKARTNPHQTGKIRAALDPSQTLNKAIRCPKYVISTLEKKHSQAAWKE